MITITSVTASGSPRTVFINFTTDLASDLLSINQITADWGATAAYEQPSAVGQMTGMAGSAVACQVALNTDFNPVYFRLNVSDFSSPPKVDTMASQYPAGAPQPGPATGITVSAPSAPVPMGGQVMLTVAVKSASGACSGKSVTFALSRPGGPGGGDGGPAGNLGSISPNPSTADANGKASSTFKPGRPGRVRVTATADSVTAFADLTVAGDGDGHGDDGGHGDGDGHGGDGGRGDSNGGDSDGGKH